MDWFKERKRNKLSREQLVSDVIRYCEDANRDVDTAAFTEKFIIRGIEYTVNVSCIVKKVQS